MPDALALPAPENRPAEVVRAADGRFPAGVSGNPGGRPKGVRELEEACRALVGDAVKVLKDALTDPDPRVRIVAAKELLDRGFGRPGAQAAETPHAVTYEELLDRLADLREERNSSHSQALGESNDANP